MRTGNQTQTIPPVIKLSIEQPSKSSKHTPGGTSERPQSAATSKVNKAGLPDDHIRAPVHDQLVKKNHRREQSANATAGRRDKNGHWGSPDAEDIRRVGSCERPQKDDDYTIMRPPVRQHEESQDQGSKKRLISPSPEVTQPRSHGLTSAAAATITGSHQAHGRRK